MGISVKRIVLTTVLAVLLVIVFGWVIMMQNHATLVRNHAGDETLKLDVVASALEEIESRWRIMEQRIEERYKVDTLLSAFALRSVVEQKGDQAVALYSNGAVIRVQGDEITAPEGIDRRLGLTADLIKGRDGLFSSPENKDTLVVYSRISDPYYCVEWKENTSIPQEVEQTIDIPGILRKTETAYDVYALCAVKDPSAEGERRVLYSNDIFTDLEEIFSITQMQDLSIEETEVSAGKEQKALSYKSGTISLEGAGFRYIKCDVPAINGYLILLSIQPNLYVKALSQGTYMFTALILFVAALLVSGFCLYGYIKHNDLSAAEETRYRPSNVRRFVSLCGVIGVILIFLSGMLIYSLNGLYDDTARGRERLRMLEESFDLYAERIKQNMDRFSDIYLDYGTHIAEAMDKYPQLREQSVLKTLADSISASSITLYDANGDETVSSGEYIGLSLGKNPESATYDFRRILKGVPSVVHSKEADETTGQSEVRVGVRIRDDSDPSRYGAMILCVDPDTWNIGFFDITDYVLRNLAGDDVILCIVSPETGEILSSSEKSLVHRKVSALGLSESQLQGGVITDGNMDNRAMFVTSQELAAGKTGNDAQDSGTLIAVYAAPKASLFAGMMSSSLAGAVMFLGIYILLAWLVIGPYTDAFYEKYRREGRWRNETQKRWKGAAAYFTSIRPEKTGLITMEVIIALYLIQQIPIADFHTAISRNSVYYYLTSGNWEKGLNLFAIAGILILLGQIVFAVIVSRLILTAVSTFVGAKGKTICRLIRSLILYVALFAFVIIALTDIGISMAAILTAVGTLGIAVSLGAQHFVSDIIAGLTMVFEGTVHVGDIVKLGNGSKVYHGEVREIGLRFIRIQTSGGNIVTLSNRDIDMTTNMTTMNSRCTCSFTISSDNPIEEIEELLKTELPKIGEEDSRILYGPEYCGISALEAGSMTLLVTAECREQDLTDVQLAINHALQHILTQNGYRI